MNISNVLHFKIYFQFVNIKLLQLRMVCNA